MKIPTELMPTPGETVLCAVSGGPDSMALLHVLRGHCRENGGRVVAAHFHHGLRENADRDAAFVSDTCCVWGVELVSGRGDVRALAEETGASVEEAARNARYAFLRESASARGIRHIYLAHHADDNAETVLLNLIRGSGTKGLGGMRPRQGALVRPFLGLRRSELLAYVSEHGIPYVEDETNLDPAAADRNRLRLEILPRLEKLNARAVEHINAAAGFLRAEYDAQEEQLSPALSRCECSGDSIRLPLTALAAVPEGLRPRLLLEMLDRLGCGRKDIGARHLAAVLALKAHGQYDLPGGLEAANTGEWLLLARKTAPLPDMTLSPGELVSWGDWELTLSGAPASGGVYDCCLKLPPGAVLTVRPPRANDRLDLAGGSGPRSVKRLFRDRGIPPGTRDRSPALYVGSALAAVFPLGVDRRFAGEDVTVHFAPRRNEVSTMRLNKKD